MDAPLGSGRQSDRVLYGDEAIAVGEVGPILVVFWRGAVTRKPFEKQEVGLAEVVARNPGGAGFLCIVEANAKAPDDDLRRASAQMIQAHAKVLKCVACVMEGEGFRAAINRGAFAGMVLLLRDRKLPVSVFARVDPALEWMAGHLQLRSTRAMSVSVQNVRTYFSLPTDPAPSDKVRSSR
ncbi:MAG TPA: hypothetical protein VHU80_01485 [Polyangiaceae bacterium]|jgi:hypothetical protein|nr:hypothetical protein [Polyangiaceae bacterium]